MRLTAEQRVEARSLRSSNMPVVAIAKRFGCSPSAISMLCRKDRPAYHIEIGIPDSLGSRLRNWRQHRDLSAVDAAAQAGIHRCAWTSYELNKKDPPSKVLKLICKNLNLSADYLLGLLDE